MSQLSELLHAEERVYALQEPKGPLQVRWSEGKASPSLTYRKFHLPRQKSPSAWNDFSDSADWTLAKTAAIKAQQLAPLSRPQKQFSSDKNSWLSLCEKAERAIASGSAQKLVPARETSCSITPEEHSTLLRGIADRLFFPSLENAYRFLIKSRASVFFGATPELLFRRENGDITVPAIAGTLPRGEGAAENLFASAKDRAEHEWVVQGIVTALKQLGLEPSHPKEPLVLEVPGLVHLYTPITAKDNPKLSSDELLEALHPTPAISGTPKLAASNFLFENESWDRGLFSAPLLFRDGNRDLCLVAIRSALLTADKLYFFAGAGYVKGSTPEGEWMETEKKLQVLQKILFGSPNV